MDPATGKRIYAKQGEIVSRRIAGETILVPIRGRLADMQRIFSLNAVGEYIWDQLDGEKNLDEISLAVQENFDVGEPEAASDIEEFMSELQREDLVTEVK